MKEKHFFLSSIGERTTIACSHDPNPVINHLQSTPCRREFFSWVNTGLAGAALAVLLREDRPLHAASVSGVSEDLLPHFPAVAKRVVHIVLSGGLSHVDSFDYKPKLTRHHGQSISNTEGLEVFFGKVGLLRQSDWEFRRCGDSGLWISNLFPHLSRAADELTVIRSMVAETPNHMPATFQQNTGFPIGGFPVLGSWISYGLGSESDELPAYVVIPDVRGLAAGGSANWTNGFLPARHQGVPIRSRGIPIDDLAPRRLIPAASEQASREYLATLNEKHLAARADSDPLAARIHSYELAAKMQLAVPLVANLEQESAATHQLYGLNHTDTEDFGRSCLLARRLLERGVRFVQIISGGAFGTPRINWDGHEDNQRNHSREAIRVDKPMAGLIMDLRRRGMLDDTLVLCTTEFGRTPFTQSDKDVLGKGRDHNQYAFSVWMAGAGLQRGLAYGVTDELGLKAVENPVPWSDFHATVLHLLGIDHTRLTFYHNGIRRRITNVGGNVIGGILI